MKPNWLRDVVDYLAYVVLRVFVCVVQAMPMESCMVVARGLATICCDVLPIRRDVIAENLEHAFPKMTVRQRRALAWKMWEHLFLFVVEVCHAPRKIHQTNWRDYITLVNADQMVRAFFDDRPTVALLGHYGNFELSGYVMGLLGFPTYTIVRPLDNRFVNDFLLRFRGISGQHVLAKKGSSFEVDQVLDGGGILALLGDQYAGRKGCWVDFFGRPASSHKAIALFTLLRQAPMLYCYARRGGRPLEVEMGMGAMIDPQTMPAEMHSVPAITQWYTGHLEATIRQVPEQYWWLHRRWKDTRGKKRGAGHQQAA